METLRSSWRADKKLLDSSVSLDKLVYIDEKKAKDLWAPRPNSTDWFISTESAESHSSNTAIASKLQIPGSQPWLRVLMCFGPSNPHNLSGGHTPEAGSRVWSLPVHLVLCLQAGNLCWAPGVTTSCCLPGIISLSQHFLHMLIRQLSMHHTAHL